MKLDKALRREKKIQRRRNGMRSDGGSVFIINRSQKKRDENLRRERQQKERRISGEI